MQRKHPPQFEPAGAFYYFKKAIDVIRFNTRAMTEVAGDPNALRFGLVVTAIGGALTFLPFASPAGLVVAAILSVGNLFLFAGFVHLMAGYAKGKEEFMHFVRIMALAGIIDSVAAIPIPLATFIAMVWSFVVAIVALEAVYDIARGRAVLCVVLSALAISVINVFVLSGPLSSFFNFPTQ